MKTYHYHCDREIPVIAEPEILVVGGGCAGFAAAVCAARRGHKTLLAERSYCLGGTATEGMVGPFMTCSDPEGKNEVIKGFFREFVDRLIAEGGALEPMSIQNCKGYSSWHEFGHQNVTPFNIDAYKVVAEDLCREAGAELLYGVTACDVVRSADGKTIDGVCFQAKEGPVLIRAKIVIDCTGDADIAWLAGCPTLKGEPGTGEVQAASLFFSIEGVDEDVLQQRCDELGWPSLRFEKEIAEAVANNEYPVPRRRLGVYKSCGGTWKVNATRIQNVDGTCSADLTRVAVEGRQQVRAIFRFLRKYVHGFEHIRLLGSASAPGIRETRRIEGKFILGEEDIVKGTMFPDAVAVCSNSRDNHKEFIGKYIPSTCCYSLPYRVLLPQGADNLLAAGRNVSCDRAVLSAIRVMPPCFALGQAAGNAAALALDSSLMPPAVDTAELQKRLRAENAVLPPLPF